MSLEPAQEIQHSFQSFLWKHLDLIDTALDNEQYGLAASRACRLILFMPLDVKKQMEKDRAIIIRELTQASSVGGASFHIKHLNRSKNVSSVALHYLPDFIDKLTALLDAKGYLEQKPMSPRHRDKTTLRVT